MQTLSIAVADHIRSNPLAPALHSPLSDSVLQAQTKKEVQPERALAGLAGLLACKPGFLPAGRCHPKGLPTAAMHEGRGWRQGSRPLIPPGQQPHDPITSSAGHDDQRQLLSLN